MNIQKLQGSSIQQFVTAMSLVLLRDGLEVPTIEITRSNLLAINSRHT